MRTKLTPGFVKTATAIDGKDRTIFWDQAMSGFGLMVTAAGSRSYVVQYRSGRSSRRLTIDGVLSLNEARKQAKITLGSVAKGGDPLAERRAELAAGADTLQSITEEYLARESKHLRSHAQRRSVLERLVFPKLGARPIADIKRSEIVRLLDHVEDTAGPVQAHVVLAYLRRVFNWHASRSDDFRSPIIKGMARHKANDRERILTDDELRAVWQTAEASTGPWGAFIRFLLLTATRRNETARMVWTEVVGTDWTIPAGRYKTNTDVTLPLSQAARGVLAAIPRFQNCPYVFTNDGRSPISGFSKSKKAFDQVCGVKGWTLHDLRRTGRSLLSRAGIDPDHAERCLGHKIKGVRGTYDRHAYQAEMLRAFEALAQQIDRIVNPTDNVVHITGRG
jgi:integrase